MPATTESQVGGHCRTMPQVIKGLTIKKQNMRKLIAAINMTLDGFCDHTIIIPDEEIHQHYADLLDSGDVVLYGRTTYQLMQYWQTLIKNPSGDKSMDDFAVESTLYLCIIVPFTRCATSLCT